MKYDYTYDIKEGYAVSIFVRPRIMTAEGLVLDHSSQQSSYVHTFAYGILPAAFIDFKKDLVDDPGLYYSYELYKIPPFSECIAQLSEFFEELPLFTFGKNVVGYHREAPIFEGLTQVFEPYNDKHWSFRSLENSLEGMPSQYFKFLDFEHSSSVDVTLIQRKMSQFIDDIYRHLLSSENIQKMTQPSVRGHNPIKAQLNYRLEQGRFKLEDILSLDSIRSIDTIR